MTIKLVIPRRIWSQNARDKAPWQRRHQERKAWTLLIRSAARGYAPASGQRHVMLMSYRARLIEDDANLRGGAKECVDALVHAGMLVDDSDDHAYIRYVQIMCKRKEERTEIILTDTEWSMPHVIIATKDTPRSAIVKLLNSDEFSSQAPQ